MQSISGVYPAPTRILLPVLVYWQSLAGVYPSPTTILLPVLDYWQSLSDVFVVGEGYTPENDCQ
jgi:hypothetical protein